MRRAVSPRIKESCSAEVEKRTQTLAAMSSSDEGPSCAADAGVTESCAPYTTPETEGQQIGSSRTAALWSERPGGVAENPSCKKQKTDADQVGETPSTLSMLQQRVLDRLVDRLDSKHVSAVITNPLAKGAPHPLRGSPLACRDAALAPSGALSPPSPQK